MSNVNDTVEPASSFEKWLGRKWPLVLGVGLSALVLLIVMGTYNSLIERDTAVQEASGNVKTLYQRRMDLIPNLVRVVEAAGFQERDTLREVTEARARATQITIDPSKATPEQLQEMQQSQGMLAAALGKLLMVREAYPVLKSNQNFLNLQSQVEGSENRIQVGLQRYNHSVADYKNGLQRFPSNVVNRLLAGFSLNAYSMFEAKAGAENAPDVQFQNPARR